MASGHMLTELKDTSELVEFYPKLNMYLTPVARLNISVTLPQLKDPGQSISNWDLMERVKKLVFPTQFTNIRVARSTIEFVRFEADLESKTLVKKTAKTLDGATIKVIGFYETLKVKAAEARPDFPARHDWDTFFRDSKHMNELHPGERPDTIYLANMPTKWFVDPRAPRAPNGHELPSDKYIRKIFETFGEIRCVDVPVCDPFRSQMSKTGMRMTGFSFGQDITFEVYVQFVEYIGFTRAMDALRGMLLVHFDDEERAVAAEIKVEFDKTKHLGDKAIRRRRIEREQLSEAAATKAAEEAAKEAAEEARRLAEETEMRARRETRAERRRLRRAARRQHQEAEEIGRRIKTEERKLLVAHRKLHSIRLLAGTFGRLQSLRVKEEVVKIEEDLEEEVRKRGKRRRADEGNMRHKLLQSHEDRLRSKMKRKFAEEEARRLEARRVALAERIKRETVAVSQSPSPVSDDDDDDDGPHVATARSRRQEAVGRGNRRTSTGSSARRSQSRRSRSTRSGCSQSPRRRRNTGDRPYGSTNDLVQVKAEPAEPGEVDRWQHDKFFEYNPPQRNHRERDSRRERHSNDRHRDRDSDARRADRHRSGGTMRMHRVATAPAPIAVVHSAIHRRVSPALGDQGAAEQRHMHVRLGTAPAKRSRLDVVTADSQSSSSGSVAIRLSPHSTKSALVSAKQNVRIIIEDRSGALAKRDGGERQAAAVAGGGGDEAHHADQSVYVGYSSDEAEAELPDDPVHSDKTRKVLA